MFQLAIQECLVDFESGRQTREKRHQSLAVRLARSEITQHRLWIVPDSAGKPLEAGII